MIAIKFYYFTVGFNVFFGLIYGDGYISEENTEDNSIDIVPITRSEFAFPLQIVSFLHIDWNSFVLKITGVQYQTTNLSGPKMEFLDSEWSIGYKKEF